MFENVAAQQQRLYHLNSGCRCRERAGVCTLFRCGRPIATDTAHTFADGLACRQPPVESLEIVLGGAATVISVSEDEIASAIRYRYNDTHNLVESAGAALLTGLLKYSETISYGKTGIVLCGGNIDMTLFAQILGCKTPKV